MLFNITGLGVQVLLYAVISNDFTALLKDSSPTFDADSLVKHTISMKRQSKAVTTYKTI